MLGGQTGYTEGPFPGRVSSLCGSCWLLETPVAIHCPFCPGRCGCLLAFPPMGLSATARHAFLCFRGLLSSLSDRGNSQFQLFLACVDTSYARTCILFFCMGTIVNFPLPGAGPALPISSRGESPKSASDTINRARMDTRSLALFQSQTKTRILLFH